MKVTEKQHDLLQGQPNVHLKQVTVTKGVNAVIPQIDCKLSCPSSCSESSPAAYLAPDLT